MPCSLSSTAYNTFQQCINNVPVAFDLLEVITLQAWTNPLIEEALPCPKMCQQASHSQKPTEGEAVNKEKPQVDFTRLQETNMVIDSGKKKIRHRLWMTPLHSTPTSAWFPIMNMYCC